MASTAALLALLVSVAVRGAAALRERPQHDLLRTNATASGRASAATGGAASGSARGTLNFLFMLRGSLPHADVWLTFFDAAPPGSWRAWAHCTEPELCEEDTLLQLLGVKIVSVAPTKWCDDLVTAQQHLLDTALLDTANGSGAAERFVLLSDTTLPIKPFASIHRGLLATDESSLCMRPAHEWPSASVNGTDFRLVKHSQWVVLTRPDAEEFALHWPHSPAINQWDVPLMGADNRADWTRSLSRSLFSPLDGVKSKNGRCPDEEAVFALLFGAAAGENVTAVAARSRCHTYIEWKGTFMWLHGITPRVFNTVEDEVLEAALDDNSFYFARKFSPTADVPEILNLILGEKARRPRMVEMTGFLQPWGANDGEDGEDRYDGENS
mmetsp:Transcript_95792/g.254373  ORF Transcript_95792/g.254373 Transcript_95792/m.254373 type:complete len:383 (-) Transcript_95792:200-1348(-)